jgi:hypothetical protein
MIQAPSNERNSTNIAGVKASDRLPVKASALSRYSWRGPQLQQSVITWALSLAAVSSILLFSFAADAGLLKGRNRAVAADYFDFPYAEYAWNELTTLEMLVKEADKYSGDFDPWKASFKQKPMSAMGVMRASPAGSDLKKGYDLQLAYDEWRDHVYADWYSSYKDGRIEIDFDQWLAERNERRKAGCGRGHRNYLDSCGPLPDWRSEQNKADERAMMAEADRLHGRH